MDNNQNANQNINIKIPDEVLRGTYANNMWASHTKDEFILDFINITFFPPPGQGIEVAKVITSPVHFKQMVKALTENLKKYEEQFGSIESENSTPSTTPSTSSGPGFGYGSK